MAQQKYPAALCRLKVHGSKLDSLMTALLEGVKVTKVIYRTMKPLLHVW